MDNRMRRQWLLGLVLFPVFTFSQHFSLSFERLDIRNGLSQNHVSCILQDQLGFLWFGTDDGLNRYDGYQFKIYNHIPGDSNSLASDVITTLFQDRDSLLWIGTDRALQSLDLKTGRFSRFEISNVYQISQDTSGALWLASYDRGAIRFSPPTRQFQTVAIMDTHDPGDRWAQSIHADSAGRIWLGTYGSGLKLYDPAANCFRPFLLQKSVRPFARVVSIEEGSPGFLWAGCKDGGLICIDVARRTTPAGSAPNLLARARVQGMYRESEELLWLATDGEGLIRVDCKTGKYRQFLPGSPDARGLSSRVLDAVFKDRSGIYWIGTFHEGLCKLDAGGTAFTHTTTFAGLAGEEASTWAFAQDRQNNFWIGTASGLVKWDRTANRFEHISFTRQFHAPDGQLRAIHIDREGILWLGYLFHGLVRFDPITRSIELCQRKNPYHPLPMSKHIYCIAAVDDSCLWLGTNGSGLIRYDKHDKKLALFYPPGQNSLVDTTSWVTCILPAGPDRLWLGTWREGLRCFDLHEQAYITTKETRISQNRDLTVTCLLKIRDGRLAIGTYGQGLALYDSVSDTWEWHNQSHGLPSGVIHGLLQDRGGQLWLSTNRGLARLDPVTGACKKYDDQSGSGITAFNQAALFQAPAQTIFAGGLNGFQSFDPADFSNRVVPVPVITGVIKFAGYPVPFSAYAPSELRFSARENYLGFEFVGLHYKNPADNEYACKLEGLDQGWLSLGHRRAVHYGNLSPGSYTFRVKSANSDGLWSEETALPVIITPPFWRTWWFMLAAFLLLTGTAVLGYRNRIAHARAVERARYRERQQVQEEMMINFHDEVGSAASIIQNYSVLLKNQLVSRDEETLQTTLDTISGKARELFDSARRFIQECSQQNRTLAQLLDDLQNVGEGMFMESGIRFELSCEDCGLRSLELPLGWYPHLANIFREGMHNIKRHARGCDRAMLTIKPDRKELLFELANNGTGFDPALASSGLGLRTMRLRAGKIGARLILESAPSTGTRIAVHLQLADIRSN
jgi:ligand-binding sensor domain-containing protein